jgi:carbonic anhydrase
VTDISIEVMSEYTDMIERNRAFAETGAKDAVPAIPFIPNRQLYVITCIDPRVDPADILGLTLGDAIVARTVGGRVTPAVLQDLAWISYLHEIKTPDADWFDVVIIHHTDCGSGFFADEDMRRGFARRGFDDEKALADLAVIDPAATVKEDVATLLKYTNLSSAVRIAGLTYDLDSGLISEVASPARRAHAS